ncbi:response regulator [Geothrix sp. PMB-07]|uniref:response regulator n=1 Tax=Geothrix sp. PMB-07 TaxID=3068640 RepID=UPI00274247A2|nr:response regulator [Geothrix sp. PMB-07]WLT33279.1 response regulator [Geothrix sp. PMB-07]
MILLVEDDQRSALALQRGLEQEGFQVDVAFDGETGLHLGLEKTYDILLLDVMLPGLDGFTFLAELRAKGLETPVIFLTARDALPDRLRGLGLGGGDYLVKPFAFSELVLRIRNLLQRQGAAPERGWTIADLSLDPTRRKVYRGGQRLDLTAQEYALLELLARNAGHTVTRMRIAETLWDLAYDGDPNLVDAAVRRLRRKVDDPFTEKLIHTHRSVGYRMEARHE